MTTPFRRRLRLARLPDGWMVLDVESGRYFRANATGARVAAGLARGASVEDLAERLCQHPDANERRVTSEIAAIVDALARPSAARAPDPVRFVDQGEFVQMHVAERHAVDVSRDGRAVVLRDGAAEPRLAANWLRLALPHALTLQGLTVLHASAILVNGAVHAFSGASGAGKSTWGRALVASGAERVADDLVVLSPARPTPRAALGGEELVRSWAEEHARLLGRTLASPTRETFAAWSRTAPLATVSFLAGRHAGSEVRSQPLAPSETCAQLLANSFAETQLSKVLGERLRASAWLARHVRGHAISVPEGVERLGASAASYRARIES